MNMYTGQLRWTEGPAGQVAMPAQVATGEGPEAAFALLYAEVLDLNDELGAEGFQMELLSRPECTRVPSFALPAANTARLEHDRGPSVPIGNALGSPLPLDNRAAHPNLAVRFSNNPVTPLDPNTPLSNSASDLNREHLAGWLDSHALARSTHRCALFFRQGMEAVGLSTADRPSSGDAADYGPFLVRHGAQVVARDGYTPRVGDTVVFDRSPHHPSGHIEMYDGHHWVSDFMQHRFSPYSDAANTPPFTIYRIT